MTRGKSRLTKIFRNSRTQLSRTEISFRKVRYENFSDFLELYRHLPTLRKKNKVEDLPVLLVLLFVLVASSMN